MIHKRSVPDLRNHYTEIETTVKTGEPVFLTKNSYGTMVVMSIESHSKLADMRMATPFEEKMMDDSDHKAEESGVRLTHEEVFGSVRSRISDITSSGFNTGYFEGIRRLPPLS